jgi:N-acetylmuramoyl-L-alanine amidase
MPTPTRLFKVVIDAGHGGADTGTIYDNGRFQIAEKDVTLMLARQAAKELRARGYQVLLTRQSDEERSLPSRTGLANRIKADLFLSIHMNSAPRAEGIETYILNNATDASSRRLAHLENSVLTAPGHAEAPQTGTKSDVALILKDLRLDANLSGSKLLACHLVRELAKATPRAKFAPAAARSLRNRGVKQALFHVLLGADMPSVLLEAGFLSNPKDRAFVLSPEGRTRMGEAIAQSVEQFRLARGTRHAQDTLSRCQVR